MKKIVPYKVLTAVCVSGCIFLSCENNPAIVNNLNKKSTAVEEAKNIVLNYTLGGKTKAILTSPLMLNVDDTVPYIEFPSSLHADFYNEEGKIESVLTAKYARYKQNQNIVFLKDSVQVVNLQEGDTLYCAELYWDRSRVGNEFYTNKPVRIRTKTQTINGAGMESSQDFKNWNILDSRGVLKIPASQLPN